MVNYGNRGMGLEGLIEDTNKNYFFEQKALVQKVPTPVKVTGIDQRTGRIKSGFYEKKSTVDFIGVFNGISIAFDAKESKVETRFDLKNVKEHQYYFLGHWINNGGIGFLIINFTSLDEYYYLPYEVLDEYWTNMVAGGRKSIPYKAIAKPEYEIKMKGFATLDYLSVLEEVEGLLCEEQSEKEAS